MRKLSARLLLFNLMLVFLPLGSLLYLDTYEKQMLATQENSMIQQGRIFSSALSGTDLAGEAGRILDRLAGRVDSRIRIVDREGNLLADSASRTEIPDPEPSAGTSLLIGKIRSSAEASSPAYEPETGRNGTAAAEPLLSREAGAPGETGSGPAGSEEADSGGKSPSETLLYRTIVYPLNLFRRLFLPPGPGYDTGEYYSGKTVLQGPEIRAALEGRYGAITRFSTGGQISVNLYSAIPVPGASPGEVVGAVLVSRSTYSILRNLYELRLDIIRIFLFSLLAALLLSLVLSLTITVPMTRLTREAARILDQSGRFREHFTGLKRKDEIGDLSRALSELSGRLEKRISFIDRFTVDLFHELKNPLAAIRGAAELSLASEVREEKLLRNIREEELRMERLLAGLRELSRLDNRTEGKPAELTDLAEMLPLILSRYPHREFPSVRVEYQGLPGQKATVKADPDRLVQMVTNPVDNALSFSPPAGTVTVRLEGEAGGEPPVPDGFFRITVEDQGPGVDPASLPRVFNRFYSDRPENAGERHSGLGLAIVEAAAAGCGGRCFLENLPGGGCRFTLLLPRG